MFNEIKKRKMNVIELVAMSFSMFKENFRSYFDIAVFVGIPVSLVFTIVSNSGIKTEGFAKLFYKMLSENTVIEPEHIKTFVIYFLSLTLINAAFSPLITMATARFTKSRIDNEPYSAKDAALASFGKGTVVVFAAAIREILLFAGTPLIFPWVIMAVYFNFFAYAIILDNKGIFESLKYSAYIVKGEFFNMLLSILAIWIMDYALGNLIQLAFSMVPFNIITEFLERCVMSLGNIVFVVSTTLLYLNRQYMKNNE